MNFRGIVFILALVAGLLCCSAPCKAAPVAVAANVAAQLQWRNYLPEWSVDDLLVALIPEEPTHLR